jgi:hypothetical protein
MRHYARQELSEGMPWLLNEVALDERLQMIATDEGMPE